MQMVYGRLVNSIATICFVAQLFWLHDNRVDCVLGQKLNFSSKGAKNELNGKFLKQPDNTTLIAGKRLLLRCRPNLTVYIRNLDEKNANHIKYEWFRDNRNIQPSTKTNVYKDGSLEIIQASESDSGFYKCIAKFRSLTFESRQAYVKVVNKSLLPTSTQPTTVSKASTNAVEAKAVPKFYLWPEDKNIRLNEEIVLECLATNDMSVHADLSQNASESSQPQYFKYKWLKNGIALDFKNRDLKYKLVQGFNLKIDNATESDTGTYTCRICNWNSNKTPVKKSMYVDANDGKSTDTLDSNEERDECDERSAFMNVLVPPRFVKQPLPMVNATLKSDVELECSVYGVPMPQVQWFKNGEPLYSSEYFQFNPTQGTLKILGIIAQDEGYYQCVATNELNTIQTITQLVVQLDEDYQQNDDYYDASDSKVPLGRNKPQHQSNNKPSLSTPRSAPIIHLSAPDQLKLIRARSRSVTIEWQAPPIMSKSKPTDDETLYYSINWKAKNMPRQRELNTTNTTLVIDELTPETVYLVQVSAILASTRSPTANLEFKTEPERATPSRPVDFRAELLDLSPPIIDSSAPATSNRVLKLKWKRPVQNWQSIVKYRIFYQHMYFGPFNKSQQNKSDEFQPVEDESPSLDDDYAYVDNVDHPRGEKYVDVDVDSSASADTYTHEFSLDELLKYSTYKFRLVALDAYAMSRKNITENGANEESNQVEEKEEEDEEVENSVELTVETPSDVPDAPPEDIQVETLNTSSIQVNWNLPAVEKRNGIIIGYKIAIKENDKQVWNSNVDAEPRRKIISGLLAGHKYSFRLTARTANGSGPASDWHIAETFTHEMDESRVPGQPLEIFTEPTDKSIIVHWSPPSDSNITVVRKYLLKFGIGFPITEVELAGNRNSYIINNLTPSSQYVISLKAGNNIGYGMEILKDVITKRKSALSDSENLFPPLNVQAVAISPQSIEVKWTDWHLKPEETIPDDRYYTIRYCVTDASKEMYKFKNSTERNAIVSDLAPNTMYDFSVKLIIGRRESDWSMTTSQMTMETSPAPRSIKIASDPSAPSSVIISWMAPKVASNNGYVISYIDEAAYKENGNKWKMEHVSAANAKQDIIEHRIKKLKLETIYYFKIQSRNNRAYSVSSPTIIFKTPNAKGKGGGKIYTPNDDATGRLNDSESRVPIIVLNRENQSIFGKNHIEMNMVWIIITSVSSLFALVFILFVVFMCNRSMQSSKQKGQANERLVYERNGGGSSRMMPGKHKTGSSGNDSAQVGGLDVCMDDLEQQQQLLSKADLIMQSQMLTHLSCSNSSTTNSTLIKQQHSQRTPSHNHHHNQPLMISNPNHMMMNVLNQPLTNNSQTITDVEFYSNVNTTGHLHHGFHHHHHHGHHVMSDAGSCYNNNSNNNGNCNSANNEFSYQSPHCGNDQHSQIADDLISNNSATATSAAIAAANLAFSSSNNATSVNEPMFLRHTIRPKPIAIPISTNNSTQLDHQQQQHHTQQSMFGHSSNVTRKSLKNLPIATATLIPSNVQTNSNQSTTTTSKLHYTARPYIIDNQVQSNCEYSNHSPASSSHSGCGAAVNGAPNQQLYDKLGNINAPNSSNASTKSLLQPLKSFANASANHGSNQLNGPNSSLSIPNTPAKYCDNLTNMTRSPAKKQLLVSLAVNTGAPTTTTTTSTASSLNRHNNHHMMGKSVEDIYDKVTDHQKMGNLTSEELTAEMANLEGIMKDLNAITAQQFEC